MNPNSYQVPTTAWAQYGPSASYGLATTTVSPGGFGVGTNFQSVGRALTSVAAGFLWHFRWVATNYFGTNYSSDQTFYISTGGVLGDGDGDGVVDTNELSTVLTNYNSGVVTSNAYSLYTQAQINANTQSGIATGISTVTNSPNTYGLYTLTQYTTNGATNFIVGRNTGRSDVTNAPNTYGLYTLTQYTTNGATNFIVGRNTGRSDVTNAPNTYNLFTLSQYNTNGATNFVVGRNTGRSDVTNSPNTYGLYTISQLQALEVNAPLLAKNPTNGMFKLTIGVQRAPQLTNFVAFPMNGVGFSNIINGTGKLEFYFSSTNNAAFFRLLSQ